MSNTHKVILGVILSLFVLGGVGLSSWFLAIKVNDADWTNKLNEQQTKANAKVRELNNSITRLETEVRDAQQDRTADYLRGVEDGKSATEKVIADLRNANGGLWLQVQSSTERADSAEAAALQSKRDATRAARLSGEASEALIRIAADGDKAIRQLNLCQVEYKVLYSYNSKLIDMVNELNIRLAK